MTDKERAVVEAAKAWRKMEREWHRAKVGEETDAAMDERAARAALGSAVDALESHSVPRPGTDTARDP